MNPRIKRITGLLLMLIACLWIVLDQMLLGTIPIAEASEAPDRHYPKQETFSKQEAYDLSFALASDIRHHNPNFLWPAALLIFASWLFHSSRAARAPTRSDDSTATNNPLP